MYTAHFAELEIDTETGEVKVLNYVAAHDCDNGTVINPAVCKSQVSGGVFTGVGYILSENLVFDEKTEAILNQNFIDYKILSAQDLPDPEIIFVEPEDSYGVYGIKGIGEGPSCPVP